MSLPSRRLQFGEFAFQGIDLALLVAYGLFHFEEIGIRFFQLCFRLLYFFTLVLHRPHGSFTDWSQGF
jgi:hypothetical protein